MKMPLILFAALAGSFSAVAADFVLSDGTVLKEASVVRRSVDSVLVRHSNGVQKLFFDRLSPELQKQLGMTPELVAERRAAAEQASAERRRQRAEAQVARLAALQASGQYPRYLSGADIFTLFSEAATLTAPTAEYLAALWNHREATRLNLPADAERYAADMATRRPLPSASWLPCARLTGPGRRPRSFASKSPACSSRMPPCRLSLPTIARLPQPLWSIIRSMYPRRLMFRFRLRSCAPGHLAHRTAMGRPRAGRARSFIVISLVRQALPTPFRAGEPPSAHHNQRCKAAQSRRAQQNPQRKPGVVAVQPFIVQECHQQKSRTGQTENDVHYRAHGCYSIAATVGCQCGILCYKSVTPAE